MPRISRVPSMAAFSLALPTAARWLRPKGASPSFSSEKTGGLAHGPDEKRGLAGRVAGCTIAIDAILPDKRPSLGRGVPLLRLCGPRTPRKSENATNVTHLKFCTKRALRIGNLVLFHKSGGIGRGTQSVFGTRRGQLCGSSIWPF